VGLVPLALREQRVASGVIVLARGRRDVRAAWRSSGTPAGRGFAGHRHDQEWLSVAEIARLLGRAEAAVKAHLYNPACENVQGP
jgi:hypothetical protein